MNRLIRWISLVVFVLLCARLATAQTDFQSAPFQIEKPAPDVTIISDGATDWGGAGTGISHQNDADYWIEKTIDVPLKVLADAKQVRLRVWGSLQDYSHATLPKGQPQNGLDESFELVVNGHSHVFRDDTAFIGRIDPAAPLVFDWQDFFVPVEELRAGPNTFLFRKTPSPKNDDFLYIGIDPTRNKGHSRSSLDAGKTWRKDKLNVPGTNGEYMMKLIFISSRPQARDVWNYGDQPAAHGAIGYSEYDGKTVSIELDTSRLDRFSPMQIAVEYQGGEPPIVRLFDENGKEISAQSAFAAGKVLLSLPPSRARLARVEISPPENRAAAVRRVAFDYTRAVAGDEPINDLAPRIAKPKGAPLQRAPRAALTADGFLLENAVLQARFSLQPSLHLVSLTSEFLKKNVLLHPELTQLFLIEKNGNRFGARDWKVQNVQLAPDKKSVTVQLRLTSQNLAARLRFGVDGSTLRCGLQITNVAKTAQTWKTAFPHFGGIVLSPSESDDYYLFPYGGGIISSASANLRAVYGEQSAWWQMMDLFSPSGGVGLFLRADDASGLYKSPALRKGETIVAGATIPRKAGLFMAPEMMWQDSLQAAPGTAMTFEYLQRTRAAGQDFSPPDAVLGMHDGDYHNAMQEYSRWAHRVWKWRPFPSKLHDVWNIVSPGWGGTLFKDGKYREDYITPQNDLAELMSWWQWSDNGPWRVPYDELEAKLGKTFADEYKKYFVPDPITGKMKYPYNRGDYTDGYNRAWGGLPALRAQIETIQKAGKVAMLYTDPVLADDNTRLGHEYGLQYGVVNPFWVKASGATVAKNAPPPPDYVTSYASWNMCADTQWYQDFLVKQMAQIARDTGADGIRLDEYGHLGYPCFSEKHTHLFAEPGHNAWLQAVSRACEKIHAALDEVRPGLILTAEFPGYDHMAHALDGAISYDTSQFTIPAIRPLPANLFRFYFPEHKLQELDNVDNFKGLPHGPEWKFWNAICAFGVLHPPKYHRILQQNGDAFDSQTVTPLIPTLASRAYANRFEGGGKTIYTILNARGFTVDEPLLALNPRVNQHVFDLLNGREIALQNGSLKLKLRDQQVACIALLPRRISAQRTPGGLEIVSKTPPGANAAIELCDKDGTTLLRADWKSLPARGKSGVLWSPSADVLQTAAQIKFFERKYLTDAIEVPPAP